DFINSLTKSAFLGNRLLCRWLLCLGLLFYCSEWLAIRLLSPLRYHFGSRHRRTRFLEVQHLNQQQWRQIPCVVVLTRPYFLKYTICLGRSIGRHLGWPICRFEPLSSRWLRQIRSSL